MKAVTRFQIRKDWAVLNEAVQRMDEKFVKQDDPTMSVMNFIEKVSSSLGTIKSVYNQRSDDRNQIVAPVRQEIGEIEAACAELKSALVRMASGDQGSEDANKDIED